MHCTTEQVAGLKKESKYLKLFEAIKAEIACGEYPGGTKIPGENELSEKYNMSRQTVRQSLSLLEQEGLVKRRQGSGTYVTKQMARKKKTWNVGVVATYISEYIFPSILRGIQDELSQAGFSTIVSATQNRVDSERRILTDCLTRPIDGLIIEATKSALPNPNIKLYEELKNKGIPVVFFNGYYPVMKNDCTYVIMNDKSGGYKAVSHLIDRGHKKIGGIFKSDDIQGMDRYAGYLNCLSENGLSMQDQWVIWFNSENRAHMMEDESGWIIESLKDCTAIVCYNDEIAVKLINAFSSKGYNIPEDKAIVSFDNSLFSEVSLVPITSMDHPKEVLGSVAARKLVSMIEGGCENSLVMEWGFSARDSG